MVSDPKKLKRLLRVQNAKAIKSRAELGQASHRYRRLLEELRSVDAFCGDRPDLEFRYGDQIHSYRTSLGTQVEAASAAEGRARNDSFQEDRKTEKIADRQKDAERSAERQAQESDMAELIQRMIPNHK